jgi:septum formation protein
MTVFLASQSPRRLELLRQIGIEPQLLLPGPDEDAESLEAVQPGEAPADYVRRVTRLKLQAAQARHAARLLPPGHILCADTTVAVDQHILGKPADAADAAAMLRRLSGREHQVHTALAVAHAGEAREALCSSSVWVAPLSDADLAAYIASGEPFGKAGAYGIQGRFAAHIMRIAGSHSGIVGLPLFETSELLQWKTS